MPRPTTITTAIVKTIRELYALGVPKAKIAKQLGVSEHTVYRYATPEGEAAVKAEQRRRYERQRKDPEVVERYRAYSREYQRRERAKEMESRPEGKREAGRRLKALRAEAKQKQQEQATKVVEVPRKTRSCRVCSTEFTTHLRSLSCSQKCANEYKRLYLKQYKLRNDIGDDGMLNIGAAGGGHRIGAAYGD